MFPDVPAKVRWELERRGCLIPQSYSAKTPHNVVRGRFTSSAQQDLAVLCSRKQTSSILVLRAGLADSVAELAARPDRAFLQGVGPAGEICYSRAIGIAAPEFIREHHDLRIGIQLPPLDHDGINDIFVGKGSIVWYWSGGGWLQLAGAN